MNQDLVDALRRDYPTLYFDGPDLDCGDGWEPVVRRLSARLEAVLLALPEDQRREARVLQVKQKFNGLRYYMAGATREMEDAIYWARGEASCACEVCGRPSRGRCARCRGARGDLAEAE